MRIGGSLLLLWILTTAQFVEGRAPKILSFEISRRTDSGIQEALRRRDATKSFTEVIANIGAGNGYTANVSVGTPPQPLILGIDTGSTDTWVLSNAADICVNGTVGSCAHGTFNANKSSTVETVVPGGFDATYVDKSGASGDYITDILSIAGNEVKTMQMGLAFKSTDSQGTLGLGYATLESAKTKYPSFIDQLVAQGFINSKAFSLYLNDLSASTGNILFGGIDTAKFSGTLETLPLIPALPNGAITYYGVVLTSVNITFSATNTTTFPLTSTASDGSTVDEIGVVLDSGAMFTYLPTTAVNAIYALLNAVVSPISSSFVYVNCGLLASTSGIMPTVSFQFTSSSGPTISVPLNELVFPLTDYAALATHISELGTLPFEDTCLLGLLSTEETGGAAILGDTFLRSAYVVYDQDSNSIGIAQTVFDATGSNVVEFGASESGFPIVSGLGSASTGSATASKSTGTGTKTGGGTTLKATGTGGVATSSTSKAAAGISRPLPLDGRRLIVFGVVGLCYLLGAGWFLG